MSDTVTLPDWVVPDGPAYLMHTGGWNARITPVVIVKTTARDVVAKIPNGTTEYRFRKDRMETPYGGGEPYFDHPRGKYHEPSLVGPNDPRVAEIEAANRVDSARSKAHGAVDAWLRDRSNVEKGREAATLLNEWADLAEAADE